MLSPNIPDLNGSPVPSREKFLVVKIAGHLCVENDHFEWVAEHYEFVEMPPSETEIVVDTDRYWIFPENGRQFAFPHTPDLVQEFDGWAS